LYQARVQDFNEQNQDKNHIVSAIFTYIQDFARRNQEIVEEIKK
jgi:hypothetical protein